MSTAREAIESVLSQMPEPNDISPHSSAWFTYRGVTAPAAIRKLFAEHDTETAALRAQIADTALKGVTIFGELQNALERVAELEKDGARLEWLTFRISGKELRSHGVTWPAWSLENMRVAIDAAIATQGAKHVG